MAQADQARCPRMKGERALHTVALEQMFAPRHLLENFSRNIFSFEQQAELGLVERRIIEQCEEHVGSSVVKQPGKLLAGGDERALAIWFTRPHAGSPPRPIRL